MSGPPAIPRFDYSTPLSAQELLGAVGGDNRTATLVLFDNGNGAEVDLVLRWKDRNGEDMSLQERIVAWKIDGSSEDELIRAIRHLLRLANNRNTKPQYQP